MIDDNDDYFDIIFRFAAPLFAGIIRHYHVITPLLPLFFIIAALIG